MIKGHYFFLSMQNVSFNIGSQKEAFKTSPEATKDTIGSDPRAEASSDLTASSKLDSNFSQPDLTEVDIPDYDFEEEEKKNDIPERGEAATTDGPDDDYMWMEESFNVGDNSGEKAAAKTCNGFTPVNKRYLEFFCLFVGSAGTSENQSWISIIRYPARKSRIFLHIRQGMPDNPAGYPASDKKNQIRPNPTFFLA